jgi:hypothetical protein
VTGRTVFDIRDKPPPPLILSARYIIESYFQL